MAATHLPVLGGHPTAAGSTCRQDEWWASPLATFAFISSCLVYLTWALFQGEHYYVGSYLSPVYSPVVFATSAPGSVPIEHALFGAFPAWWPAWLPATPAMFALIIPGALRFTCYYYRKAYYRAFVGSPPGCAVVPFAPEGKAYHGETNLLLFQNLHRYAMYFALLWLPFLAYDALISFYREGQGLGIGVGSLIVCANTYLLTGYAFGCHSFRHVVGGHDDCMSCGQRTTKFSMWKMSTWFNERHMLFAMVSLGWVAFTDLYIRLVSMGVWTDLNTWD